MTAILEITDGTTTVDLLRGPWYLRNWRPAVSAFKNDGVFIDSPLSDYRSIAFATLQNVTERMDMAMQADSADLAALYVSNLLALLQQASNYWISNGLVSPVYMKAKSTAETNERYTLLVMGNLVDIDNPYGMPFLQSACSAVMDNLVLLLEHQEWTSTPPGESLAIELTENSRSHNLMTNGSFARPVSIDHTGANWTTQNSPTTSERTADRAHSGRYSWHIVGTAGADRGIYQVIDNLDVGSSWTVTARCMAVDGVGQLIVYDSTGSNPVTDSTSQRGVERISNTGFETDLSGWNTVNQGYADLVSERSNTQSYAGTWSAKLSFTDNFEDGARFSTDSIALVAFSTSLSVSMAYYIDTMDAMFDIQVVFLNAAGQRIKIFPGADFVQKHKLSIDYSTGQWFVAHREAIQVPDDATHFVFEVEFNPTAAIPYGTLIMYIDEATVTEQVPAVAQYGEWQELSVTKTIPASGSVRVAVVADSSSGGDVYFDSVEMSIDYLLEGLSDDKIFFSNVLLDYNFTHVFRYDASLTTYSGNLLDDTLPYQLFPSSTAVNDEILFCSQDGPFSSILFNIGSVVDASTFIVTWEYMNNSSWTSLSVIDNTSAFTIGGKNVVVWDVPVMMTPWTVNGVYGYWVKAKITSISGLTQLPLQSTFHPQTVAKPFFDIESDNVGGDIEALAKYSLFNELGPSKSALMVNLTASADDAAIDNGGTSISTSGSEERIQEDRDLAVRFQSVAVPQGARITRAKLYCTPGDWSNGNMTDWYSSVVVRMYGEDADTSAAWSTYANYAGRTRTTAFVDWAVQLNGWGRPGDIGENTDDLPEITSIVQEIVDRDGWASGNDLSIFLQGHDSSHSTADYGMMYMDEEAGASVADEKWMLELEWINETRYTTSVLMGSRSLSRGSEFNAFINANDGNPDGIEVSSGPRSFKSNILYNIAGTPTMVNGFLVANGITTSVVSTTQDWDDRVIIKIYNPLAEQYTGRFRAFVRARTTEISGIPTTKMRLRISVGVGGSSFTNVTTFNSLQEAELVDMGPVVIPPAQAADSITLAVQTTNDFEPPPGPIVLNPAFIEIFDVILLPVDEWSIEATSPGTDVLGYLDGDSFLELDSINSKPRPIVATIKDKKTEHSRAFMITSGSGATVDPSVDQRVWVLTTSYIDKPDTIISTGTSQLRAEASLSQVVHSASMAIINRYRALRGAQ
jgi:hypothetical protein